MPSLRTTNCGPWVLAGHGIGDTYIHTCTYMYMYVQCTYIYYIHVCTCTWSGEVFIISTIRSTETTCALPAVGGQEDSKRVTGAPHGRSLFLARHLTEIAPTDDLGRLVRHLGRAGSFHRIPGRQAPRPHILGRDWSKNTGRKRRT